MPNASRSKIRDTQIRCPLMQGLPKQTLASIEIFFSSSLRSITPDSARDSSLKAITLAGAWSRMEPNAWQFEIDPILTAKRRSGIIVASLYWGVAKWQGTGFWSRDRRFESCRPSRGPPGRRTIGEARAHG